MARWVAGWSGWLSGLGTERGDEANRVMRLVGRDAGGQILVCLAGRMVLREFFFLVVIFNLESSTIN